jgi:Na+-translocating ferredoxin:NAD+ oxidoreductase RnfD subunit
VNGRPLDRTALAFGIAFIVAGVLFLLDRLDVWNLSVSFVLPVFLIALGVGILLGGRPKEPPAST